MTGQPFEFSRGIPYEPITPRGQARQEPLRPGKTETDHASGAWQRRLQNRKARAEGLKRGVAA